MRVRLYGSWLAAGLSIDAELSGAVDASGYVSARRGCVSMTTALRPPATDGVFLSVYSSNTALSRHDAVDDGCCCDCDEMVGCEVVGCEVVAVVDAVDAADVVLGGDLLGDFRKPHRRLAGGDGDGEPLGLSADLASLPFLSAGGIFRRISSS